MHQKSNSIGRKVEYLCNGTVYETLIVEDKDDCEPMLTVLNYTNNEETYASELRAMQTRKKKEALSEIVKLIKLIHNIVEYQNQESLLQSTTIHLCYQ